MEGEIDALVEAEFPGLTLVWQAIQVTERRTSRDVAKRLEYLAGRIYGKTAVSFRTRPEVIAIRTLYRQVGIDPNRTPPPAEVVINRRIESGGFRTTHSINDALTLAAVETAVSVWAVDIERLPEPPPLRLAAGENGALQINGTRFGEMAFTPETRNLGIYTFGLPGVSQIAIEEALWIISEALH